MSPRWLLTLALICGFLFAPLVMSAARAHAMSEVPAASHCAGGGDVDQHAPTKQFRCMGGCSAVEADVPRLAVRAVLMPIDLPISTTPSLGSVLPEHDTPPPRLS